MAADADRHLLFGLLALQVGLIDQAQLVVAFHAWTRDKARPLADHFQALGHLDAEQRVLVEALAAQHIKKHDGDAEKSLAAVGVGASIRRSLAAVADPQINTTLVGLVFGPDGDPDRTASYSVGGATSDGQRFRILRPHAQGGLGAVSVAMDTELHREVALKQILDQHADDPHSRARFLVEAEITGKLEHPGIIPVYGLGHDLSGRPFYAMRLVKGESLKEAVARFHQAEDPGRDPRERSLELRRLLGRFIAVCNTIAFAHSLGVIHRDLKPANILLGPFGETLVIDWGLAKVVGRPESVPGIAEATLRPALADGAGVTLPGSTIGTPAFMSPEQAAGRLHEVGPASDVYSLGATLYCLLTGRPPIEDRDVGRALLRAQWGEFLPPRSLNPAVEPALEAICVKAMALKPEERYPSPRELVDDIEVLLASDYEQLEQAHRDLHGAHEALKVAQSRMVQTEKLAGLGQLVAGVVHEINNPLAFASNNVMVLERDLGDIISLIGLYRQFEVADDAARVALGEHIRKMAEQMDLDYTNENLPRLIERTREGLRRIERIIKDIRLFAQVDEGDRDEVDLDPGIESTLNILRKQAYDKHLQLLIDLAPLPPVRCVAAKINQVVANLVMNAFDACAEGGMVTIRTQAVDGWVRIEVTDDGCGIDPGHRDRIFDPFFTTKLAMRGNGLGLSISLGIVKDYGGRIEVESAPGRGSTFTVHLPAETGSGRLAPRRKDIG